MSRTRLIIIFGMALLGLGGAVSLVLVARRAPTAPVPELPDRFVHMELPPSSAAPPAVAPSPVVAPSPPGEASVTPTPAEPVQRTRKLDVGDEPSGLGLRGLGGGGVHAPAGIGLEGLGTSGAGAGSSAPAAPRPTGNVVVGDPTLVQGAVDPAPIKLAIRAHKSVIGFCYRKALENDPTLKGMLVVRMEIGTDGHVTSCDVQSDSLHSDALAGCVTRTVRTWILPVKPEQPMVITYPFDFATSDSAESEDRRVRMGAVGDTAAPDPGLDQYLK